MKTQRSKASTAPKLEPEPPAPAPVPKEPEQQQQARRIFMYLNEDGSNDINNLREATKEKLENAVKATPFFQQQLEPTAMPLFGPEVIGGLYNVIGMLEARLVSWWKGVPPAIAAKAFAPTPQEIAGLTPLTSKIPEKYSSEWMKKYRDECTLLLMLSTLTLQKFELCAALMKQAAVVEMPKREEEESSVGVH